MSVIPTLFGLIIFHISHRFPYLLPNALGASWALLSMPLVLLFVPETLPKKNNTDDP